MIWKGFNDSLSIAIRAMEEVMAAKAPSVKRYVVRLSAEERQQLEAMVRKGKSPAQRLLKARILLKSDVSEDGEVGTTAGSSRLWRPAFPWSIGCASNWWKKGSRPS